VAAGGVPGESGGEGGGGEGIVAAGGEKVTCFLAAEASPAKQAINKMQATFIVMIILLMSMSDRS